MAKNSVINYTASPTLAKFHQSNAFVRGVMGPIGSGKSVASCIELFLLAKNQPVGVDGKRRCRSVIIRNTLPELETTTIKTWDDWFSEELFGRRTRKPPYTQTISIHDLEWEVIFLALDREEDVKKLLSLECTNGWVNEAREVRKTIIDALSGRVGRYPSKKFMPPNHKGPWPYRAGIIMDTNPPDNGHWWYEAAEEDNWLNKDFMRVISEKTGRDVQSKADVPDEFKWEFFQQPSGLSKDAENLENLPDGYYHRQLAGKTKEWVTVYVHGMYGTIMAGKPVYGDAYNDELHISEEEMKPDPKLPIYGGFDFGLTPAAVFGQRLNSGRWVIHHELTTKDMGLRSFSLGVRQFLAEMYGTSKNFLFYGDPSGAGRDQQEETAFEIFAAHGIYIQAAPGNNVFAARKESVLAPLGRLIDGKPGFIMNKSCVMLRRGFNGGYRYRKLNISGGERYTPDPEKNEFSHPHDALQYLLMGGGEFASLITSENFMDAKPMVIQKAWSTFSKDNPHIQSRNRHTRR